MIPTIHAGELVLTMQPPPKLPYTQAESLAAYRDWKATCGHHSIAAACGVSLDQVKAVCPKLCGWMSPTMISQTLFNLGFNSRKYPVPKRMNTPPGHMVCIMRIQWDGPWCNPGVPAKAAYLHTHYVAVLAGGWVVCTATDGNTPTPWARWVDAVTSEALESVRGCTGWYSTHIWTPYQ